MTCEACTTAERQPDSAEFAQGCDSCQARALAAVRIDELGQRKAREAIAKLMPKDPAEGERMVREWLARLKQRRIGARET